MNWLIAPVPLDTTMNTVLARVIRSGIHSAWVCVAIQGRAATSWRTLIGRSDILKASANPTRAGDPVAAGFWLGEPDDRAFVAPADGREPVPLPSSSIGWVVVAPPKRRRASARWVLL